jgi:hypothetical protein
MKVVYTAYRTGGEQHWTFTDPPFIPLTGESISLPLPNDDAGSSE